MIGRPRKPAALRDLHASRRRLHHQDEPTIPTSETATKIKIAAPVGLVPQERAYWDQFAPLLTGARVLTPADVETLADYCRACAAVDERGKRLRTELRRREMDRPLVGMLDRQLRGWLERKTKLASELGLTAVSRTRVAWSGYRQQADAAPQGPKSKLAQLQEQAAALRWPVGVK